MNQHTGIAGNATSWSNSSIVQDYKEEIAYDANGNILTYFRNGTTAGGKPLAMDNLSYRYLPNSNKLDHVSDTVTATNYTEDIDNQDTLNYTYDAIGNLTKDVKEGIDTITWTVYGKINSITKANGTVINYGYDAAGSRIVKTVNATGMGTVNTFYVRDAQGNTMSVYADSAAAGLKLNEQHVYGSSRLGMYTWGKAIPATAPVPQWLGGNNYTKVYDSILPGSMSYELSNHLGNVLSVISDKKIGVPLNDTTVAYYVAEVLSQNDYYPFGMMMPGRKFSAASLYRYGFNGKENDNEVKGEGNQQDYGMRIYDPRIGKFLSVDPLTKNYPWNSTYAFAENDVIRNVDLDGLEKSNATTQNNMNNKPLLSTINAGQINNRQQTLTLTLDKRSLTNFVNKISTRSIDYDLRFPTWKANLSWYLSSGAIENTQNPIDKVYLKEYTSNSEIITNGAGGKILKTTSILKVTEVNVKGRSFGNVLKDVKITTTTTITTQNIIEDGDKVLLPVTGNGYSSNATTSSTVLKLSNNYVEDLWSLPGDLGEAVDNANDTNRKISGAALKGINDNMKKLEDAANDGNLVPGGRGTGNPSKSKPASGNF